MQQSIIVVEDDRDLCGLLEYNLTNNGYAVKALHRLDGAFEIVRNSRPDLLILDVMLPDGDGFEFCRQIRTYAATASVPILFVTARSLEEDRVLGLEIGGDDYITKPFSTRELMARVKAHLRRGRGRTLQQSIKAQDLEIDYPARKASLAGTPLELTATEFALLGFLAENAGKAYTREQLIARVWDGRTHITPRNVDVHVRRLREQIEENPKHPKWIRTVRGFGYRFEIPS